jgi:electron transfer flavoprotein alpha subunit
VLHADGEQFAHGLAETVAAQILAIASDYSHIPLSRDLRRQERGPARSQPSWMSARSPTSRKVIGVDTFERPIYAGNAIAYRARALTPRK